MPQRILLVEDEAAVASMLRMVLEVHDYEVEIAASARAGIETLRRGSFAVVITDMKMESETSGFEVARAAASHPDKPAVLILTGFPMLARDWKKAGAHAVLQKPAEMGRLLQSVRTLLEERQQRLR